MLSERRALEERQAEQKAAIARRYESCLDQASASYQASWARACKRIRDQARKDYAECISTLKLGKDTCDGLHRDRDKQDCPTLPRVIGTDFETTLEKARDRCLQESAAGLQ